MGRNEITILKYVYVDEGGSGEGDFEIYLRVNDNWELLHGMELVLIDRLLIMLLFIV